MTNTLPVSEITESLGVQPVTELDIRNKFVTGAVTDGKETYFLKAVKEGMPASVNEDLNNEVAWNTHAGPYLAEKDIRVPFVVEEDWENRWALFEYLEGRQASEDDLHSLVGEVATLGTAVCEVPLEREGEDLSGWYTKRLDRFRGVLDHRLFTERDRARFGAILDGAVDLSALQAGIIHGDLTPKNLLIASVLNTGLGLTDSEFGTTPDKPEWDKPRYHDLAYYYHLMLVQYHSVPLAQGFLLQSRRNLAQSTDFREETFDQEFQLSVLERTVSMANHFVVNQDPSKKIDDVRRTRPEFYVQLIKSALNRIVDER